MHIRSKFDGGKQINRSQSGAWDGRCAGAVLRQNYGANWGPVVWESITAEKPNQIFTNVSEKMKIQVEKDRKRKSSEPAKESRRQAKHKKTNDTSTKAKADYTHHNGPTVIDTSTDVPQSYLQDQMIQYYNTKVMVSDSRREEIERATRHQGIGDDMSTNLWLGERKKRITSTVVGTVARRRPATKIANLTKSLQYRQFRGNAATTWGKEQEPHSERDYLEYHHKKGSPLLTVQPSGLVIHPEHHWLAASPDGLVEDPEEKTNQNGIVEYKNPYSHRELTLREAAKIGKSAFCLKLQDDGTLSLRRTHAFFYQVQATMACTQTKWCDFVVRTKRDIQVERIRYDPQFWSKTMTKLKNFYYRAYLPELSLPRHRSGGIREPCEWIKDESEFRTAFLTST